MVVAFATAIGMLSWLGSLRLSQESVRVRYFFDEDVSGLDIGASVKFRGVNMGKVVAIRAANDQRHVEVEADLFVDALRNLGLPDSGAEGRAFALVLLRLNVTTAFADVQFQGQ